MAYRTQGKALSYFTAFNPQNSLLRGILIIIPVYRERNCGSKRLVNLYKVRQPVSGRVQIFVDFQDVGVWGHFTAVKSVDQTHLPAPTGLEFSTLTIREVGLRGTVPQVRKAGLASTPPLTPTCPLKSCRATSAISLLRVHGCLHPLLVGVSLIFPQDHHGSSSKTRGRRGEKQGL